MDTLKTITDAIIQISFDNLPVDNGWTKFEIQTFALRKMIEINAFYATSDGNKVSFNPKYQGQVDKANDLTFLFMDLRSEMYKRSPEKGAWYSCTILVDKDGGFNINYDYDNKPGFAYQPSPDKFKDDLNAFPRENELIPDWLSDIIK